MKWLLMALLAFTLAEAVRDAQDDWNGVLRCRQTKTCKR